ncbi:hypothetical protein B0H12DRAFT_1127173 [Mycena haematopus]|nr:hypothetical protein B0H12DRAFT_1127173 [Mycena haematopus]
MNPIYPSNLSAALFEMGSYNECTSAILRSFAHLDSPLEENSSLASRLSTRLAKSLSYAFAAGTHVSRDADVADQLARIEKSHSANEPESGAWRVWRTMTDSGDYHSEANLARQRLIDLPLSKKSLCISHDDIFSLLRKSSEFPGFSLTGEEDSIDLTAFSKGKLSNLAFLFGGVGDARHVFGTVITLYETFPRLSANQKKALKVHITLLDLKEHALARDLVVMFLLSKIMACTDAIEKVDFQATLFYLYTALVMPQYCYDRFSNVLKEMQVKISQDPVNFLPWIRLDNLSVSAIKSALLLWVTRPVISAADYVSQHHYLPDEQNSKFGLSSESDWYKHTKAFLAPSALWTRHPEFTFGSAKLKAAAKHVKTTWVINPSLFDSAGGRDHYVLDAVSADAFDVIRQIATFQKLHPVSSCVFNKDSPAFGYVTAFFDSAIIALKSLGSKVRLEFIHGDIRSQLLRMRAFPESRIAQNLPVRYTKMWLSNVPDYISGPLGTAVFVVPSLHDTSSTASANHLLNFPMFMGEPASFCNTYVHLQPRDLPKYLGCRAIYMNAFDVTSLAPVSLPRPNQDLAKREELKTWLIRIFLSTLVNGKSSSPITKVMAPNNIIAFIWLLIHLQKVGYPGHWLGDFLATLLCNTLVTDTLPFTGIYPISPEAIVARIRPALPFIISLPAQFQFPAADDIGLYCASVFFYGGQSTFDPVAGLLFFNPAKVRLGGQADWPRHIPAILRGEGPCKATDICVVLTIEELLWGPMGEVRWRMNRTRVARMKAEGWAVAVYGTHNDTMISAMELASLWKEVVE